MLKPQSIEPLSENIVASIVEIAQGLMAYPSVTGAEIPVMEHIERVLNGMGWRTERWLIPGDSRFNIFATPAAVAPRVVFTTHLDVVPAPEKLFTPQVTSTALIGRGACDAKGIAAVMIQSAESLRTQGVEDVGLLFVVEEETTSAGARAAVPMLKARGVRYIVNGEPTDGKLIIAQKGVLAGRIAVKGKACHSGYPHLGVDANGFLIELAHTLRAIDFGEHPQLGAATINIGTIKGGSAGNIVASSAELSFWVRAVSPAAPLQEHITKTVQDLAAQFPGIETAITIQIASDPIQLLTLPGFSTAVFCGGSDVAYFVTSGATCLMYGPGSLVNAHTDDEHITLAELLEGFEGYRTIYRKLSP